MTDREAVQYAKGAFEAAKLNMTRLGLQSDACQAQERLIALAEECLRHRAMEEVRSEKPEKELSSFLTSGF